MNARYVASKKIPPETVQEMMRRSLYKIKWYFSMTNLNTVRGKAANKKVIMKYVKWYTPKGAMFRIFCKLPIFMVKQCIF